MRILTNTCNFNEEPPRICVAKSMGEMFLDNCTYDVAAQDLHTGVFQFQQQMHNYRNSSKKI
jgi:hypothetical protein